MQARRGGTQSNSALISGSSQSDGKADAGTDYDNTRWQIQEQRCAWVTMEAQRRRSREGKCLRTGLGLRERVEG